MPASVIFSLTQAFFYIYVVLSPIFIGTDAWSNCKDAHRYLWS